MLDKLLGKRMLWLLMTILLACLLAPAAGWASESGSGGSWPQFQSDLYNDGLTGDQAPAGSSGVSVAWQQQVGNTSMAGINSTPLVAGGNVFVLDALGKAWAFDASTGIQKWATQLSSTKMKFQLATPAYDNGTLYVATNDGHVYALDAANGDIRWHVPLTLASSYSQLDTPVKYAEGKIYVGGWNSDANSDEYYYCLKADDGSPGIGTQYQVPNSAAPGGYYWAGSCMVGRCLVFGSERSVVTCLDKDTGALLSSVSLKVYDGGAKEIRSSVSFDPVGNMVFLTDQGGNCWGFSLEPAAGKLAHEWHTNIGIISTSTPAVSNGKLYVGTGTFASGGGLYCLDEQTGGSLWSFMPTGQADASVPGVQASPAVSVQDGTPFIYFVTNWEQSSLFCLDQAGNQVWQYQYDNPTYTTASLAAADGWLYFGNDAGWLYALKGVAVPVTGVALNKTTDTIAVGGSDTLTATVTPSNASNKSVTWASDNTAVATVDAAGKVTGVAVGTAAITATTADGGFTATCAATVTSGGGDGNSGGGGTITVKLTIQDQNKTTRFSGNVSVQAGKTVMDVLQTAAQTDPAMNPQVDWDNPYITGGYVESLYGEDSPWGEMSEGWVFFVNGVFANRGAARYNVTSEDSILWQWSAMTGVQGAAAGAATVPVTGVTLNKTSDTIAVDGSDTLTATVTPAGASNKTVTWASDNAAVATVDATGKVTGVAVGGATITATTADGAFKAICTVTVQAQQSPQPNQQPTQPSGDSAPTFKDLPPGYWAGADIEYLAAGGYLKGYDDDTFRPDQPVTRAEFAAMLVHVLGMPYASGTEAFSDVHPGDWYYGAVGAGLSGGLLSGYSDGRFGPDDPVTREQLASMLGRALAGKEGQQTAAALQTDLSLQFKDAGEVSDWARSAVAMLTGRDLAHGYEDGNFRPKAPATRAECAVMLRKLLP